MDYPEWSTSCYSCQWDEMVNNYARLITLARRRWRGAHATDYTHNNIICRVQIHDVQNATTTNNTTVVLAVTNPLQSELQQLHLQTISK